MTEVAALLRVEDLVKHYTVPGGVFAHKKPPIRAVDGITFTIDRGETLSLVGESGCGKTTAAKAILRLEEATSGRIFFEGINIGQLAKGELRKMRSKMQIVFQDPYAALNPKMTVGDIVAEPLVIHKVAHGKDLNRRVSELLETVGLSSSFKTRYPKEFSGGQRQRIGVARAMALNPKFIVLDEPVSALDVSIQAQILNLMQDLQDERDLTYLFITHNLSVVKHVSDDILVMYLGNMVEFASSENMFKNRLHPYTKALLAAVPIPRIGGKKERRLLKGEITSVINPKPGCRFAARCDYAESKCFEVQPELVEVQEKHFVACHYTKVINNI